VALPPVIDLDTIDRVRDSLIEAVETGPLQVSGAAVERLATNALFMLVSAADTARHNGFAFALTDPSPTLRVAVDRLGLTDRFAGFMKG